MRLKRTARAVVAVITAILLSACQTAFAVHACADGTPSSLGASPTPCHDIGLDETGPAQKTAANTDCGAPLAVAEAAHVPTFGITDLPVVAIVRYATAVAAITSPPAETTQAVCSSPPLSVLHCRFLN
jgi:hypothetical protein